MGDVAVPFKRRLKTLAAKAESLLPRLSYRRPPQAIPVEVVGVYSSKHSVCVRKYVDQARGFGYGVHLWSLDSVPVELKEYTLGSGRGTRNDILNRIVPVLPSNAYVLIIDDDCEFRINTMQDLVDISHSAGFALSQPAHTIDSYANFRYTFGLPHLMARSTLFIENGPCMLVSPDFRNIVFPMTEGSMGWEDCVVWSQAKSPNDRFGLIDAVKISHLKPMGGGYDLGKAQTALDFTLAKYGMLDIHEIVKTLDTWKKWQHKAPWM